MIAAPALTAHDRCLPVDEAILPLLPDAGLPRGRVIGCGGSAAMSLALALVARSVAVGAWLAAVGVPALGIEAARELGVSLSRIVMIERGRGVAEWAERVAAAADGFEMVLTCPPPGAERLLHKIRNRLQARGVVMVVVGHTGISCDIEFTASDVVWAGLGDGYGVLTGRRAVVRACGRRIPRPVELEVWLPSPRGRIETIAGIECRRAV